MKDSNKINSSDDILAPERETINGRLPGDKAVRLHRPKLDGVKKIKPGVYEISHLSVPQSWFFKILHYFKIIFLGKPIKSDQEIHERLTKIKGVAVFASDCISSSAYATEEIMRILILGGASAILIDYVLTVSVSASAGIYAVVSAFPALHPYRILLCIASITLITIGNLRGIRESGNIFALPVYLYIFSMFGVLGFGIIKYLWGGFADYTPVAILSKPDTSFHAVSLFLILKAFSSGACGLTGVEAVADGVPAFKPPEAKNARITQIWTGILFGSLFISISFLSSKLGIIPDPNESENLISQLVTVIAGKGWYYYLVQFSTMLILILAANTSFADFPRLASFLSKDKFIPSQFAFRGDRLAFNNGIIFLAILSIMLIIIFHGSVTSLIPLYTIGVFIAFTLSQSGMVVHWWRLKTKGWQRNIIINAFGAITTFIILIVVAITKFSQGAWAVLFLIPISVIILLSIYKHYQTVSKELVLDLEETKTKLEEFDKPFKHYFLIPVADINRTTLKAIEYSMSFKSEKIILQGIHVTDNIESAHVLQKKWEEFNPGFPLIVLESPYRLFVGIIMKYIEAIEARNKNEKVLITLVLPEFIPSKLWKSFLHSQMALRLKAALLFRPGVVVINVPYHLR